jgi:hypothetical protein
VILKSLDAALKISLDTIRSTGKRSRMDLVLVQSKSTPNFPHRSADLHTSALFSQLNFGIVTKMGMTLMPNPGGQERFLCASTSLLAVR